MHPNLVHGLIEEQDFIMVWLREILNQRLPAEIPGIALPRFRSIFTTDAWVGTYTLAMGGPGVFVGQYYFRNPEVFSKDDYGGDQGNYISLPSRGVARQWLTYCESGAVEDEPVAVAPLGRVQNGPAGRNSPAGLIHPFGIDGLVSGAHGRGQVMITVTGRIAGPNAGRMPGQIMIVENNGRLAAIADGNVA